MISFINFIENCSAVLERISRACESCGRKPDSVVLLPVTKTHPPEAAKYAAEFGFRSVGENRVQEALEKMDVCDAAVGWELIGHLQSNKARVAAARFGRIQSVDSVKLLRKLAAGAQEAGRILPVLLQLNAGDDPAKFGVPCCEAPALLEVALEQESLRVDGLMTIAPLDDDVEVARRCFARLRETRDDLEVQFGVRLPELSMGMSGDLEAAIAEGSTMVRVGSALFGARD